MTEPTAPVPDEPDPEEFAEHAGIDPSPQDVDHYLELADEQPPWSNPAEG